MIAKYYPASRIIFLTDYQRIGIGKNLFNFIAQLYVSQTKLTFYILTSRHAGKGKENNTINNEIQGSFRKRITVSLRYIKNRIRKVRG